MSDFIFLRFIYLFIFGCFGSELWLMGSLLRHVGSSLWCAGFSLVVACRFPLVVVQRLQGAWAL